MSDVREPAPLAPLEDDEPAVESSPSSPEALDDEATPLPPAMPHHLADPTGYSIEKLLPQELELVHPEDDATIPEHVRNAGLAPPEQGDAPAVDVDVDVDLLTTPQRSLAPGIAPDTEDEQTRPRVRLATDGSEPTDER